VKSLAPGEGIELSSTSDLVTIAVPENLRVARLTPRGDSIEIKGDAEVEGGLTVTGPSQFAGVDASGVVAQQVVWVTGGGAPAQSIMFPGSLQLGKWRLRGNVSGEFYLERFDDDGAAQTGDWYRIATWGFNTEINSPGMAVDNLGVANNLSAGNITATGNTSLQAVSATELETGRFRADTILIGPDELGIWDDMGDLTAVIDGKLRATNNLETAGRLRADTLAPFFQGAVRVDSGLNVLGDLTIGELNVANALAASEPAFTAVAPLQKAINLSTGQVELRVDTTGLGGNPFWAAGTIGSNGAALSKKGQVDFTCVRTSAGNYRITFAQAHPDGAVYVISLTSWVFFAQVNGSIVPTAGEFRVRLTNGNLQDTDAQFYFSVLA
jgi:hypothetical protein